MPVLDLVQEKGQIAFQVPGDQEVLAHMLMALLAQPLSNVRMSQQKPYLICRSLHGVSEQTRLLVNHLGGNAANGGGHHWLLLPQSFGDSEPEALTQALLDDHCRSPLKGIDFQRRCRRQLKDE